MKTTVLQSFFKTALLFLGMAVGFGCDDSDDRDDPGKWEQEGMELSCQLVKTVENGKEVTYPLEISPVLVLKSDLTLEGDAVCNSAKGSYKYNAGNGEFKIEDLIFTELACTSPYAEAEAMYSGYLCQTSSYKLKEGQLTLYLGKEKDSYLQYDLLLTHR